MIALKGDRERGGTRRMLEHYWAAVLHQCDTERHEQYHRLRASWGEVPSPGLVFSARRDLARMLTWLADRLDPCPAGAGLSAQMLRDLTAPGVSLVNLPRHRV